MLSDLIAGDIFYIDPWEDQQVSHNCHACLHRFTFLPAAQNMCWLHAWYPANVHSSFWPDWQGSRSTNQSLIHDPTSRGQVTEPFRLALGHPALRAPCCGLNVKVDLHLSDQLTFWIGECMGSEDAAQKPLVVWPYLLKNWNGYGEYYSINHFCGWGIWTLFLGAAPSFACLFTSRSKGATIRYRVCMCVCVGGGGWSFCPAIFLYFTREIESFIFFTLGLAGNIYFNMYIKFFQSPLWIKYLFPPCLVAIYLSHPFFPPKIFISQKVQPPQYSKSAP